MQTGYQIVRKALLLLGYVDLYGNVDMTQNGELLRRALTALNQIYGELWYQERQEPFVPLTALGQPVALSDRTVQTVMPYGVAMLLAQSENDGDDQGLFATLYNARRVGVSGGECRRTDVMPRGCDR